MLLLNTTNLELEEFLGKDVPPYAILSHMWGKDEVTFQDLRTRRAKKKAGFTKLRRFCTLAKDHQLNYAWMDTCCIDKTSSAELSEAINSMYRWYQMSAVCYAYLEDVHDDEDPTKEESSFQQSRWFTRGWTLQELIAPSYVYFYSTNWKMLGSKLEISRNRRVPRHRKQFQMIVTPDLRKLLSTITGISLRILETPNMLQSCTAAKRMSWAASRETTRPEDIAYCLMGIFDVTMPLLYGEGEQKAFNRLQEEILKATEDDTLLMHICPDNKCFHLYHPPLASSPKGFRGLEAIEKGETESLFLGRNSPSRMTPKGLQVQLPLCPCVIENSRGPSRNAYIGILDCIISPDSYLDRGVIVLEQLSSNVFIRHSNSVISRLEFEKQEVILEMKHQTPIIKATSIQINNMQLQTIHILEYTESSLFKNLQVRLHMNLTLREIEQPLGCNVVLHEESQTYETIEGLGEQIRLCFIMDKANNDAFIIILGAHKILHGHNRGQSVPYCEIFMKEPNQKFEDIIDLETRKMRYPNRELDTIQKRDDLKLPPFSQHTNPQLAALELSGSKKAVVTVNSRTFLGREEHCFKLKISF